MIELFERAAYLWQYGQHLPWRETRRMERLLTAAVQQEVLGPAVASWSDRVRTIVCERHNGLTHEWFCQQLDGGGYRCLEISRQMSVAVREAVGENSLHEDA